MKKILYITSVPWGWIKQRPQFLAEALSADFIVDVYSKRPNAIKKADLLNSKDEIHKNLNIYSFRQFPFHVIPILKKMPLMWINKLWFKHQLPDTNKYDIIWVTSANMFNLVKPLIKPDQILVYDCMDDILEFPITKNDSSLRETVLGYETELLKRADAVFCSAEYLKNKIVSRSGIDAEKVTVVNNAVEIPNVKLNASPYNTVKEIVDFLKSNKSLVYIGTIDEWFDFDSILAALNKDSKLNLVLIGPMKGNLPNHGRIHYMGTVTHDVIFDIMPHAFALVMPFKLTELIKSVNPVKLYEYIYAGVPVIATKYGETLKFKEFVRLYEDSEDLIKIISGLEHSKDIDIQKNREFVSSNTWKNRYEDIKIKLLEICKT